MASLNRLPGRHDGAEGLVALADKFPPKQVFDLILLCRTARSRDEDAGGAAMVALANMMVNATMATDNVDYDVARRKVAEDLGYHDVGSRSNFYKVLQGGRAPEKRPHSSARGGK